MLGAVLGVLCFLYQGLERGKGRGVVGSTRGQHMMIGATDMVTGRGESWWQEREKGKREGVLNNRPQTGPRCSISPFSRSTAGD